MEQSGTPPAATSRLRTRTVTWADPIAAARAGAAMSGIEYLQALADGRIAAPPFAALLGFEFDAIAPGRVVFAVVPGEHHYNPIGVAHGGLAATLLDSAMGCAVHSLLPAGRFYTSLEIKINFVKAIKHDTGRLRAIGHVVHLGRTTATAEGRLIDAQDVIFAHGSTTCIVGEHA